MRNGILPFERIRNLRIDRELTQKQMSEILNLKQTTYSKYEIGTLNYPLDILIRLARFYNTSVDYLLNLTDNINPHE